MKWFFKWLQRKLDSAEAVEEEKKADSWANQAGLVARRPRGSMASMKIGLAKTASEDGHIHLSQSAMNFRLYPATGGHIVEYSYYDERKDQNTQALHLIPSDADLGDALSKIMTLEALRR